MEHTSKAAEAEKAFLAAYESHADSLFRFLATKVSDREIARDLMQETFTRAWDYCVEGGRIEQWKPFLFRTAYNLVVDTYRKKRTVSLDAMIEDQGFAIPHDGDVKSINRAEMSRIRNAIDDLDDIYRDVLILRFTEDLPPKEIAQVLRLSENVVSVRIHRGLAKLRENVTGGEKKI
ncbi:MAG: RNA polymerase sigma-70 factor, ECF subfamily [Parcubacteria group bacterium Gr01-1014_8]|nr:MAG: RNA polymerase sigma-70 factor, ECF subfamily [Parcubacteria group bacterium Gr01-1014_8]